MWIYLIFLGTFKCFHHLTLVNFYLLFQFMKSWSQSQHPPTPFNQIEKSSWASTSTSEFSEEEIFSWFNSNCTILQTLTHEKQSGNRKMYNSFGVIQNNKKDWTARYIVHHVLNTATSLLTVRQLFTFDILYVAFPLMKNHIVLLQ